MATPQSSARAGAARVHHAVVIDSPRGRCFGTCTQRTGDRLTILTHGRLRVGDEVRLRMELVEAGRTVDGALRVLGVQEGKAGAPLVVDGLMQRSPSIPREGEDAVDEPTTHLSLSPPLQRPSREQPTELRRPPSARPSVAGAMRQALGGVRVRTVRVSGPRGRVRMSPDGSSMLLRWRSWPDASADWERQLHTGRITVHVPVAPPRDAELAVHLVLPDGRRVECAGRVLARVRDSFTLALDWTREQRAVVEQAMG